MLLTAWFVAKTFVWTRGWRMVAPGGDRESAKLRIRHLLIYTLIVLRRRVGSVWRLLAG